MIVQCEKCEIYFEDEYRSTICPHNAFPANDGKNNFTVHEDAYRSVNPPGKSSSNYLKSAVKEWVDDPN